MVHPHGRLVEHDPRSRAFPFVELNDVPLCTVTHRRYGGVFDQGSLGSCTGNAAAGAINTVPVHKTGARVLTEADAVDLYKLATVLDGFPGQYPPDDSGSSGLAVAKAAKQKGLISGYEHAFGIDQAMQALMFYPVITGVNWYEGFDHPSSTGRVEISGQIRGGHEFEVRGYHAPSKTVGCWNSWGADWGDKGKFRMSVATWARLLEEQGDVTVLLP
jgi:hypothetical protein